MIQLRDLRIGNFILFSEDSSVFEVKEITETGLSVKNEIEEIWIDIFQFEPIPLTEEWLIKFGFKEKDRIYKNDRIEINMGNHGTVIIIGANGGYSIPVQGKGYSVHWLQNLYYALTGEELTTKQ